MELAADRGRAGLVQPPHALAFLIGVGVASGSILVETYQRYRARVLQPVVGVVSDRLSSHVLRPIRTRARRTWRRANPAADGNDAEHGRPPG